MNAIHCVAVSRVELSSRPGTPHLGFRVVHYSVQRNHLHLLVESAGKDALGRGMKAISARVARAAQRAFGLRGPVLHGRYHLRVLRTPREVRHALAYVLLNARTHWCECHGTPSPSASMLLPRADGSTDGAACRARASHRPVRQRFPRSLRPGRGCSRWAGGGTASSIPRRSRGA